MNSKALIDDSYYPVIDKLSRTPGTTLGLIARLIERLHDDEKGCDGTHRYAVDILSEWGQDPGIIKLVLAALQRRGGHCDCEIVFNMNEGRAREVDRMFWPVKEVDDGR